MQTTYVTAAAILVAVSSGALGIAAESLPVGTIPIVYSTDLLHPHDDPDDHYDLATLFALPEFDLRGIVLELGERQRTRIGRPPVAQMIEITGRSVPSAVGLDRPLRNPTDTAADVPAEFQGGVDLLLAALRNSTDPVVLFTAGSCRDVAAAFNRQPQLLKEKVRALYVNAGNGPQGPQWEYNVRLDEEAYFRLFEADLPLYWCPCWSDEPGQPQAILGRKVYATYYVADQADVVGACARAVRNFFVYCLTRAETDPIAFLKSNPQPLPTGPRNMWCTAVLFHAAGREIYRRGPDDFVALPPEEANRQGLQDRKVTPYQFVPVRAVREETFTDERKTPNSSGPAAVYVGRSGGSCRQSAGGTGRQAGLLRASVRFAARQDDSQRRLDRPTGRPLGIAGDRTVVAGLSRARRRGDRLLVFLLRDRAASHRVAVRGRRHGGVGVCRVSASGGRTRIAVEVGRSECARVSCD